MVESKFFHLFITTVWMSGLFGIVLTLAFMLHARHRYGPDVVAWNMPRTQTSLFISLATFSFGLALQSYVVPGKITPWVALVWTGLAFLFTMRSIATASAGIRQGWESGSQPSLYDAALPVPDRQSGWLTAATVLAVVLLLTNVGLFAWRGWGTGWEWEWRGVPNNISLFGLTICVAPDAEATGAAPAAPTTLATSPITATIPTTSTTSTASAAAVATVQEPKQDADAPPEQPSNSDVVAVTPTPEASGTQISESATPTSSVEALLTPTSANLLPLPPLPRRIPAVRPVSGQASAAETTLIVRSSRGANVRREPSLTADVLTVLADGTRVSVVGRLADSQWFQVRIGNDLIGWMSIIVVELDGSAEDIPVVEYNEEKGG